MVSIEPANKAVFHVSERVFVTYIFLYESFVLSLFLHVTKNLLKGTSSAWIKVSLSLCLCVCVRGIVYVCKLSRWLFVGNVLWIELINAKNKTKNFSIQRASQSRVHRHQQNIIAAIVGASLETSSTCEYTERRPDYSSVYILFVVKGISWHKNSTKFLNC